MHHSRNLFFLFLLLLSTSAFSQVKIKEINFTGSTPCSEIINHFLSANENMNCDFTRWQVTFYFGNKKESGTFKMYCNYGLSQPNTAGFINGGSKKTITGTWKIAGTTTNVQGVIYRLSWNGSPVRLSFVNMENKLLHLLDEKDRMMIGNGGWGFTLNKTK